MSLQLPTFPQYSIVSLVEKPYLLHTIRTDFFYTVEICVLTYTLQDKNQELAVNLLGAVDEHASGVLHELLDKLTPKDVVLNMEAVRYFNSIGIRAWINFVKPLVDGRRASYKNCPPDFINQINMMPLLARSVQILSFLSEFLCPECGHTQLQLFDAQKERDVLLQEFQGMVCEECGGDLAPEEDPQAILYFKSTQ